MSNRVTSDAPGQLFEARKNCIASQQSGDARPVPGWMSGRPPLPVRGRPEVLAGT
jgi:hypothetical protein